jgi:hypothetical protein
MRPCAVCVVGEASVRRAGAGAKPHGQAMGTMEWERMTWLFHFRPD